jgi:hypothetical protein
MKRIALTTLTITLLFAIAAQAVPPAYDGPLGNPEEPAMRPYKWLFRGVLNLIVQPVKAFADGNMKTPVLGSVETFRGIRRGAVEMNESILRGLVFAPPPPREDLTQIGYINTWIEDDPFFGYIADFFTTATVVGGGEIARESVNVAAGVTAGQVVVDLVPMVSPVERELIEARAKDIRFTRRVNRQLKEGDESDRDRAQRLYIGDRATINQRVPIRPASKYVH